MRTHARRVATLLAAVALATVLALVPAAATEAPGGGDLGPTPNLDNSHAPADYEKPWHFWAGVLLAGVGVMAMLGVGGGYYLLVLRPAQRAEQQ